MLWLRPFIWVRGQWLYCYGCLLLLLFKFDAPLYNSKVENAHVEFRATTMVSYRPPDRKLKLKNITVLSSVCMSNYMRKLWERNGRFHKYIASQGHLTHTYVGGFSVYYTASTCKLSKTHTNKHMYSVYIHVLYVCHR